VYFGNTYGAGYGDQCLDAVDCDGTETSFLRCNFAIVNHVDPTQDVSICCFAGLIIDLIIVSSKIKISISVARQQTSFAGVNFNYALCVSNQRDRLLLDKVSPL